MTDGSIRLGVLRNLRSSGNLDRAAAAVPDGVLVRETRDTSELDDALGELRDAGVGALAIDGGDGTVRETLSRLSETFHGDPPPIALLPRGNTNLIAREFGPWRGADALGRLSSALSSSQYRVVGRPVLSIAREGLPTLRGLIFGAGAFAAATRIAQDELSSRGDKQVAMALFATLRRALFGSNARALRDGVAARLVLDDVDAPPGNRLLVIVTTAQRRLPLGLNPFWGDGTGALRWLDVVSPGRRLALATPFVAFGRPLGWMRRAGYHSGRATRMEIALSSPFTLDGELFEPGAAGVISVEAECDFRFVTS